MAVPLYQASVPVFLHHLRNLRHILEMGEAHATSKGFDPAVLLQTRLTPDMFPLLRQVQIACDLAKNGAARLAGVEPMAFADGETDFAGLYARIDRVIEYLGGFNAGQIDDQESRAIVISVPNAGELNFTGQSYLLQFSLPNLIFHISMTYAILRHVGVGLGKKDFLGKIAQYADA
ncbi:MAG: DUF1993 domain-containing protein [Lysobacteraceae bacterium]|nr:DUF1993 domain-containing protein [Xanthomonadales bacterium]HPF73311.1 DUF1993 domain-containing protein [Xanthomonadaceae bacterium]HRX99268.1 DUF1993 domain-containing protein [Xanthomonadaceae bacterium]